MLIKTLIVLLGYLATIPIGLYMRNKVQWWPYLVGSIGVLIFAQYSILDIDLVRDDNYRGDVHSIDISIIDLIAVVILIALPRMRDPVPFKLTYALYFGVALLSLSWAQQPFYSFMGVWKLMRGYIVLCAIAKACELPELTPPFLNGLGLGVIFSGFYALTQRYVFHFYQVSAAFDHQNTLGMTVNLVVPIALACLLMGPRWKISSGAVALGALCVVMSLSRGSLMMYGLAAFLVFVGSLWRKFTRRKFWALIVLLMGATGLLAKSYDSLVQRFQTASKMSVEARHRFNDAAEMMLNDSAFGVGFNNYSWALEKSYAARARLPEEDKNGVAHHIYWLTLAELGYAGIIAYCLLLSMPLLMAIHGTMVGRGVVRGDVLMGAGVGLFIMYFHGTAEWIARQMPMVYLWCAISGMVASLWRQVRRERREMEERRMLREAQWRRHLREQAERGFPMPEPAR